MFGIYARMIHNYTGGARMPTGRSPPYKSDAANTLPLSGTERGLRVKKETLSFVGRGTFAVACSTRRLSAMFSCFGFGAF